jgi:hypothetical protein
MSTESSKKKYPLQKIKPKYQVGKVGGTVSAIQRPTSRVITKTSGKAGAAINFTNNGGPLLHDVDVEVIFWGSDFYNGVATPSAANVFNVIPTILSPDYTSCLLQYGCSPGNLVGGWLVPWNPPNPFNDNDVANLISTMIFWPGGLPGFADPGDPQYVDPSGTSQVLYCVIMPVGVSNTNSGFIGEHTYFGLSTPLAPNGINAHFGWVTNNGDINFITQVFSHELVESCTDPEGSAWLGDPGTCAQGGWCEIGDVCEGVVGTVDGVSVQAYWSNADNDCIFCGPP